jgi:hypothetical protein
MGRRKNSIDDYQNLTPEELYTHVRKNVSIPKYMDLFLYKNNISLSKLVQSAITSRMQETQLHSIQKEMKQTYQEQTLRKKINERQKINPQFKQELQRARLLLTQYFDVFDQKDSTRIEQKKQLIFSDFPEMYVDIIRFEQWYKYNSDQYQTYQTRYENPVERLIAIKKECF